MFRALKTTQEEEEFWTGHKDEYRSWSDMAHHGIDLLRKETAEGMLKENMRMETKIIRNNEEILELQKQMQRKNQVMLRKIKPTGKIELKIMQFEKDVIHANNIKTSFRDYTGKMKTKQDHFWIMVETPLQKIKKDVKSLQKLSDDIIIKAALNQKLLEAI